MVSESPGGDRHRLSVRREVFCHLLTPLIPNNSDLEFINPTNSMNQTYFFKLAPSLLLVLSSSYAAFGADLIQNGGFEITTNGADKQTDRDTKATGWTVTQIPSSAYFAGTGMGGYSWVFSGPNATVATYSDSPGTLRLWGATGSGVSNGLIGSPDGGNFWATDANWNTGSLSQEVSGLSLGVSYTLTFYTATAQQEGYSGDIYTDFRVTFGSTTQTSTQLPINSHGFNGWQKETMSFTATAPSQILTFLAEGTPGSGLPPIALLDGVSLKPTAVPEPQACAATAGGLLLAAGVMRRLRRSSK